MSNPQKYSLQNLIFSQIHKSFLPRKIPPFTTPNSTPSYEGKEKLHKEGGAGVHLPAGQSLSGSLLVFSRESCREFEVPGVHR